MNNYFLERRRNNEVERYKHSININIENLKAHKNSKEVNTWNEKQKEKLKHQDVNYNWLSLANWWADIQLVFHAKDVHIAFSNENREILLANTSQDDDRKKKRQNNNVDELWQTPL